ncbi:MAG: ABC transporter permease [Candidatus Riflebacteria bacterium]|nr:ABC transporter permease [Candidatus Riflebacteria bacterium]
MKVRSLIKGSFAQFRQNLIRTALTLLGIIFGVASVIAMITIGEGAQTEIMRKIESMGADLVHINGNKVEKSQISEIINDCEGLSLRDVRALEKVIPMEGRAVALVNKCRAETSSLPIQGTDLSVYAVSSNFVWVNGLDLTLGRNFSVEDFNTNLSVALMGSTYATQFFDSPENALGKDIRINYKWFRIIGLFGKAEKKVEMTDVAKKTKEKESGSGKGKGKIPEDLNLFNQAILIPITTNYEKITPPKVYSDLDMITIKCHNMAETNDIRDAAQKILSVTHNDVSDYKIVSPLELLEQKQSAQKVFNVVLLSIASISLLVGGIGIMNIMLANVMERRHEIGVRRALGAKRRHIILQFLFESVFTCLVGGAVGVLTGMGISWCILKFTEIPIAFSVMPIFLSFGISFIVGIVFGIMPAMEAANLNPVEALHYE